LRLGFTDEATVDELAQHIRQRAATTEAKSALRPKNSASARTPHCKNKLLGHAPGYIYARNTNPTVGLP
jgi:hypothetical protein